MIILLILPFLFGDFIQKWYIPQGTDWGGTGRICIGDTDRDGSYEFVFSTYGGSQKIYFYELHLPDTWEIDSFSYFSGPLVWDVGDFDLDGLYDLVVQAFVGSPPTNFISIAESPDSFSYPTQEVWRDTVGPPLVLPICVYDIDQDSSPEIVKNIASPYGDIGIYESVGDNQYDLIFVDDPDTTGNDAPSATIAFGDFDADGSIEFVPAGADDWYWIYECTGNNMYEKIAEGQLPTTNIHDCFSVPDADSDGKPEFVVKGFRILSAQIDAFIFEATGDNTYEIVDTFTLIGGDYYGGYSDAGDVDGDSIPEIVLEARQNVFIIKADSNDSFYVWDTLPGNTSGSSVRVTNDIDGNGLNEIVISGNDETRIYEWDAGGVVEETALHLMPKALCLQVYPNPFKEKTVIRCSMLARPASQGEAGDTGYGNPDIRSTLNVQHSTISLKIYDVTGRMVKDLSRFTPDALRPTLITWYGDDDTGQIVSQGVYFLQVENHESGEILCYKVLKIK